MINKSKSLNYRKDKRTTKIFADNIKDFTEREKCWIKNIYKNELQIRGNKIEIKNCGIDNTGQIIEHALKNNNADYVLFINGKQYIIEVKTIPEWSKTYTFKVFLLQKYIQQNAYILVPRKNEYYIITPKGMVRILNSLPHNIYHGFSPNDKAVRFWQVDMDKLVEQKLVIKKTWHVKTKELIKKNSQILFRQKDK